MEELDQNITQDLDKTIFFSPVNEHYSSHFAKILLEKEKLENEDFQEIDKKKIDGFSAKVILEIYLDYYHNYYFDSFK